MRTLQSETGAWVAQVQAVPAIPLMLPPILFIVCILFYFYLVPVHSPPVRGVNVHLRLITREDCNRRWKTGTLRNWTGGRY